MIDREKLQTLFTDYQKGAVQHHEDALRNEGAALAINALLRGLEKEEHEAKGADKTAPTPSKTEGGK